MPSLAFTGKEVSFPIDSIIVSKTDLSGRMTYVNQTFCDVAAYRESELLGKPHSFIRHKNMPRCVFHLIWEYIQSGREIFGFVVNRTAHEDYYWVFAHITPSFDTKGQITGYHSNRRVPDKNVINTIISPLYAELLAIENSHANRKEGMMAAYNHLTGLLKEKGLSYDEFIFSL